MTPPPYSHPGPADDTPPLWLSYLATLALSRREEDRAAVRDTVPTEYLSAYDTALHVQSVKASEDHSGSVRQRMQIELEIREARRLADAYEQRTDRKPVHRSLTDELALPDDEAVYSVDRLLPLGGNALFAGRYKAGKTTFNANLMRSWADGTPFLGHFQCHPPEDKPVVSIFNYEMTQSQFRRWMRRSGIENTHHVNVWHLRGIPVPFALPEVRKEIAGWLRDANTGLWIIDPASRAMVGSGDSDKNPDVNMFTAWIDEIKADAGVRDSVTNIHMPHNARETETERAIGAQAWSAWADALWMLTMDKDDLRWFHALGRDVDEEKMLVNYDRETMNVRLIDTDPDTVKRGAIEKAILKVITENPGINKRGLREQSHALVKASHADLDQAIRNLISEATVVTLPGPNKQIFYHLGADVQTMPEDDPD